MIPTQIACPLRRSRARTPDPGRTAVRALYEELALYPKPGLVSPVDAGSHSDMNMQTFLRSLFALRGYFREISAAGAADADFTTLNALGRTAEARMLAATGGINTHRGAVFALGLLAAAAGYLRARGEELDGQQLGRTVVERWGAAIAAAAPPAHAAPSSNGERVARRYGAGGARAEALAGFPAIFELALPALQSTLAATGCLRRARMQALFVTMARLEDTNLLHRGGTAGLAFVRERAQRFVARGGTLCDDWVHEAQALHEACVARRLSPGGSADVLAATCFVHALQDA